MMVGFYLSIAILVPFGALPVYSFVAFAALPRLHAGVAGVHRGRGRRSLRRDIRCGRCGTRRSPSCTPGVRALLFLLGLAIAAIIRSL